MKKITRVILILSTIATLSACTPQNNENQIDKPNNNITSNKDVYISGIEDIITGEKINFKDSLEGISQDGKTFKLNDEIGEKQIEGFEGTLKSAVYIHEEDNEKNGRLGMLNTEGKVFVSHSGLFPTKVFVSEVRAEEKIIGISSTATNKNEKGLILVLTEDNEIKAVDAEEMETYEFSMEEEKKISETYKRLFENGIMWSPVFTVNPATQEKIFFEEQESILMLEEDRISYEDRKTDERKNGEYTLNIETQEINIIYDDETKETYRIIDNLGDGEIYLVIQKAEGLDVYYRQ